MSKTSLPELSLAAFRQRLDVATGRPLASPRTEALFLHYQELRVWNQRLSLIGPGTIDEIFCRHYGECVAALDLIPTTCRTVLDVGSGAGFPGLVLAALLPEARITLIEPREKKWAFLRTAARRAALSVHSLNARVSTSLPESLAPSYDLLTLRALKLPAKPLQLLANRLGPEGQILLWIGEDAPPPPHGWKPGREVKLAGSDRRRILEFRRETP